MKIRSVLIVFFIFVTILMFCFNKITETKSKDSVVDINDTLCLTTDYYKQLFTVNAFLVGRNIFDMYSLDKVNLSSITNERSILIYRYSHLDCSSCVENNLEIIKSIFDNSKDCVSLFCLYNTNKDMYAFKKMNKVEFSIFNVNRKATMNNFEQLYSQYFFILNQDCKISNVYIPSEIDYELTKQYLLSIKRLLDK